MLTFNLHGIHLCDSCYYQKYIMLNGLGKREKSCMEEVNLRLRTYLASESDVSDVYLNSQSCAKAWL